MCLCNLSAPAAGSAEELGVQLVFHARERPLPSSAQGGYEVWLPRFHTRQRHFAVPWVWLSPGQYSIYLSIDAFFASILSTIRLAPAKPSP